MDCVGGPPIVSSLGEELGVTRMPNELHVRIGVALEWELILHPVRPHVVEVRTLIFRDDVDGFPHACDENVGVMVIGVKLGHGPTHCVKKELRHTGFENEGGCAWYGYEEVVGVRASDEVVSNSPLTTIGEEPCRVADTEESLPQVHRVEVVGAKGDLVHQVFKLEGLIFIVFVQDGGSRRAGGRDWGSYHFFIFIFLTTCGRWFFAQKIR